jgi:hypothetical protein
MNVHFRGAGISSKRISRRISVGRLDSGSGTGSGRFQKSDPVINGSDLQHCFGAIILTFFIIMNCRYSADQIWVNQRLDEYLELVAQVQ